MKNIAALLGMLVTTWLFLCPPSFAAKGESQFAIGLGEALAPSLLRLSINDVDVSISQLLNISVGQRFWSQQYYTGFGIGTKSSIGFYGLVGKEYRVSAFAFSLEFKGAGDLAGEVRAIGYLIGGVSW